jgi:predicted GNAT family acetyltransferase
MTEILDKIGVNRLSNGKFAPGNIANPHGRPKNPESEELRKALKEAQKKRGNKSFLLHFVERAYINDAVAIALAKKLIPDQIEGKGFASDLKQYIIIRADSPKAQSEAGSVRI